MIISTIKTNDFVYLNMHAEEVVTSNFIEDNNIGIYGDRLQIVTLNRAIEFLKKNEADAKNIALDFKFLSACQPNLNKVIFDLKKHWL